MSSTPGWARRVTGPTSLTPTSPSWEWPALPTATPPCARRSSLDRDRHRHRHRLTVSGVSGSRFPRQESRARVDARTRSGARAAASDAAVLGASAYPTAAYPTAAYPAAPVAPRPQISFAGLTSWDYLRDVVAALLLLISLGLRWDLSLIHI